MYHFLLLHMEKLWKLVPMSLWEVMVWVCSASGLVIRGRYVCLDDCLNGFLRGFVVQGDDCSVGGFLDVIS